MDNNYFKVMGRVRSQKGALGSAIRIDFVFFDDTSSVGVAEAKEKSEKIAASFRSLGLASSLSVFRSEANSMLNHVYDIVPMVGESLEDNSKGEV